MNRNDSFDYYMKEKEEKSAAPLTEVGRVINEEHKRYEDKTEEGFTHEPSCTEEEDNSEYSDEELSEYGDEGVEESRFNQDIRYDEIFDKNHPKTMGFSVASLALSILSVIFCWVSYLGVILGVGAVILSVVSRKIMRYFDKTGIAGLILGIFGIVFGISATVLKTLVLL